MQQQLRVTYSVTQYFNSIMNCSFEFISLTIVGSSDWNGKVHLPTAGFIPLNWTLTARQEENIATIISQCFNPIVTKFYPPI